MNVWFDKSSEELRSKRDERAVHRVFSRLSVVDHHTAKTIGRADKADKVCIETKPLTTDNVNHQNVQRYKNYKKIGRQI